MQGDQLVRTDRLELDVDGERTEVPELVGRPQPDLLLVNDDDLAYAKIRLDERSTATAVAHPRGFADSLPRALVLGAAWDMTRDAEMPGRDFVELALSSLPGETDSTLLRTLLSQLQATVTMYVAPQHRAAVAADVVSRLRDLVALGRAGQRRPAAAGDGVRRLRAGAGGHGVPAGAARRQHRAGRAWPSTPRCAGRC